MGILSECMYLATCKTRVVPVMVWDSVSVVCMARSVRRDEVRSGFNFYSISIYFS